MLRTQGSQNGGYIAGVQTFMKKLGRGDVGAAAILVAGGILVSRLLGIVRDMIFAWMLGADGITDEYVAAFRIPDFANYLLAGGFLTITFIPIFARYLADDDEDAGWEGFTAIVRWLAVGIAALIALAWVATPSLIDWLYPNFMFNVYEGYMDTHIVLPVGVDRCSVIFDFFFADKEAATADARNGSIAVADHIQDEDIEICESVQRGIASRAYDTGRLSVHREAGEHLFHRLLYADLRR